MRDIVDSVVTRALPGTEIRAGHRIITTRSMGVVVVRQATPAELAIIHRHPECLRPDAPTCCRPNMPPTPPTATVRPHLTLA